MANILIKILNTVEAATVGIALEPKRGDRVGSGTISSLQVDSKSRGGTPNKV